MVDSNFWHIIEKWIDDPGNKDLAREAEKALAKDHEAMGSFNRFKTDLQEYRSEKIPVNPFFFAKLKNRMVERKTERSYARRVQWAVYAATVSLSIAMGVFLGNQFEANTDVTSQEELVEELLVDDYNLENAILLASED